MNVLRDLAIRFRIITRLFKYLWDNKMWWLIPLVALLVVFGAIIVLGHSTPLGPLIYTIF